MKRFVLVYFVFGFLLLYTSSAMPKNATLNGVRLYGYANNEEEILALIRKVLTWADSSNSISILPAISDSTDSIYVGFDLEKHKHNLELLRETDFFAPEFIENYNQIILTLDRGIKKRRYQPWLVGELPTFFFANDVSPWCNCQDNEDWSRVKIRVIRMAENEGELEWTWGSSDDESYSSWNDFAYRFKVAKVNGKWRISYMQGFDLKKSVRSDG